MTLSTPSAAGGLVVRDLHAGYTLAPVLMGASLSVEPCEFCALLGTNGSGKTTMLRAISGQLGVRGGEIWWDGSRIDRLPTWERVRRGVVHVPQSRDLFSTLSVDDNLRLGAATIRRQHGVVDQLYARVMDIFPRLGARRTQVAGAMSGGEQQMLALARGLMSNPRLMLLDEVSSALSPLIVSEVAAALGRIRQLGVAVLAVEHRPWLIEGNASRVFFLDRGVVSWTGGVDEAVREGRVRDFYLGGTTPAAGVAT